MDGLLVVSLVCGWFEWIVDGLTGLRVVSSFTTNADTLSTTHSAKILLFAQLCEVLSMVISFSFFGTLLFYHFFLPLKHDAITL